MDALTITSQQHELLRTTSSTNPSSSPAIVGSTSSALSLPSPSSSPSSSASDTGSLSSQPGTSSSLINIVLQRSSLTSPSSLASLPMETSSLSITRNTNDQEYDEILPASKRSRTAGPDAPDKLERRLGGILCCAVCMDLPNSAVFQCTNGHLMCSACLTHLLADARIRDETATCPSCRCVMTREMCSRNLAVEKAASELPGLCRYCGQELPRSQIAVHEDEKCEDRLTICGFARLGCPWRGPHHELGSHEGSCPHPNKSGREILSSLESLDRQAKEEKRLYDSIFEFLSFEKIAFQDLQWKAYRTEDFIQRLFYETSRFSAFNQQWVVKARVNDNDKDPSQVCERRLSYQLVLKSKPTTPISVHYLILKGPFGDMKVSPCLYRFDFTETSLESPYTLLPLKDSAECNKLLAAKAINFRLIMFQLPK